MSVLLIVSHQILVQNSHGDIHIFSLYPSNHQMAQGESSTEKHRCFSMVGRYESGLPPVQVYKEIELILLQMKITMFHFACDECCLF